MPARSSLFWLAPLALVTAYAAASQDDDAQPQAELAPTGSDTSFSLSVAPMSEVSLISSQSQMELDDFELMLMAGQGLTTGEKRTSGQYLVRVCDVIERTGGGILTSSLRAKANNCECPGMELNYGTVSDRGVSMVSMNHDTYIYLQRSCRHTTRIYHR